MESKDKKTILIFVDWYLPGYKAGGPIKSIYSLVNYLKSDFNFLIITSDTDLGDNKTYDGIRSNEWISIDNSVSVFYTSSSYLSRKNILQLIKSVNFDLLYFNSLFSFYFSILPLLYVKLGIIKKPVLLAPRGMLGAGALKLKSKKKSLFVLISKLLTLHKSIFWHATSFQEKLEIENVFKNSVITVVPNLQYNEERLTLEHPFKNPGELKIFFLSRISEKKNLLFALNLLNRLQKDIGSIEYTIVGPIEDALYWEECKIIIKKLPGNIRVNYIGAIKNNEVSKTISDFHFLFLPTFNENYGHAIVESLLNGKPVIISDQTPWRNLNTYNAGWDIALNEGDFYLKTIEKCLNMNNEEYLRWSSASIEYAKKYCISNESIIQTKKMFNKHL